MQRNCILQQQKQVAIVTLKKNLSSLHWFHFASLSGGWIYEKQTVSTRRVLPITNDIHEWHRPQEVLNVKWWSQLSS